MPINNNEQVSAEIRNASKISLGTDSIPRIISGTIVPVIEVGVKSVKTAETKSALLTNSTGTTIFASPSDRDTYICSAQLTSIRDATATSLYFAIGVTINGLVRYLCVIPGITLTAGTNTVSINFPHPIRIDRGSNVTLASSTNVGNFQIGGVISYFIDENGN